MNVVTGLGMTLGVVQIIDVVGLALTNGVFVDKNISVFCDLNSMSASVNMILTVNI